MNFTLGDQEVTPASFGSFRIPVFPGWVVNYFPELSGKLRFIKDNAVAILEHFSARNLPEDISLDTFFAQHVLDLQANIDGFIEYEDEETEYEILFENKLSLNRYFFTYSNGVIFRFLLTKDWYAEDELEIRTMINGIVWDAPIPSASEDFTKFEFNFDYSDWTKVGQMFTKSSEELCQK